MRRTISRTDQSQQVLALTPPYTNRGLFADNYLENHLPNLSNWEDVAGLDDALQAIRRLYREKSGSLPDMNESQTEHDFIQPVLNILWQEANPGDCYQVQVSIPNLDARRQPDYGLFRFAAERQDADSRLKTIEYWRDTACLGDAKAWSASLDKQCGADENPSAQIANYLYRAAACSACSSLSRRSARFPSAVRFAAGQHLTDNTRRSESPRQRRSR